MTASQTQLKANGFSLEFFVRSISLEHFERFALNFGQMFISGRSCAEPMAQLQRLNIKATNEGRVIKPWISCPLHISFTQKLFFTLWSYIDHRPDITENLLTAT